ncbi:carbohydrate-binding protein SusD [Chryseobacterium piperi]|uniref:Carbohydrate-binding protein SusD n=1 Tax=Chryseobacterium piperi TaxID=558152 RepID=A0A086B9N8_9FLAO|nr:RagB/SusD family nutrient uptake outer membrane protein [Chryseobacterium piperi]ASW76367.1 RagB/SusD family nutrient uptake outer membrane protein [Chryseobacterium piperi]KFF25652.1 carbohydrate-binding protein SusD [Chryseobacterium piperi]
MKFNHRVIIGCLAVFMLSSSCNVDRLPESGLVDENFWNNEEDVKLGANYFYRSLPDLSVSQSLEDAWGDNLARRETPDVISDGSRVTPAQSGDYDYNLIFATNNLLEKAPGVIAKGGNAAEIDSYVGEAYFFRALAYYQMFIRFGGVPLILRTMGIDDPDLYKPRATRDEILEQMYSDLDNAITKLKTINQLGNTNYGRVSKTAAQALKARIALFEGTRCKFHSYGNATRHLAIAKETSAAVMSSGSHALLSTPKIGANGETQNDAYYNLFQEAGDGRANRENILVRIYGNDINNNVTSTTIQRTFEGNAGPTQSLAVSYLMADGLPIDKSPLFIAPNSTMKYAEYFEKRDPRMSFSFLKRGDEFQFNNPFTIPSPTFARSGYTVRKYANAIAHRDQRSFIDRAIIRYAEVLLTYAEAVYELDGAITDTDLDRTINLLRERLPQVNIGTTAVPNYKSMPKLTNSFVISNGLNMREEIRRERRVELAFEGLRYWDLIRWKTAETELPKSVLGSYLFPEMISGGWDPTTPVDANNYILIQNASNRVFNPLKDYLWPLPTTQIAINPKITQNPGW